MPHASGCYSLPYPEGRSGACSCKLDAPAFLGESQTDRAARAALDAKPLKCSDTCEYPRHTHVFTHSADCPRYVKPSNVNDFPF